MKSKRKRERERASYRDKRRGEKGRQIVKEGWKSQRVEKLHRCRGLVGYATTTNALLQSRK